MKNKSKAQEEQFNRFRIQGSIVRAKKFLQISLHVDTESDVLQDYQRWDLEDIVDNLSLLEKTFTLK